MHISRCSFKIYGISFKAGFVGYGLKSEVLKRSTRQIRNSLHFGFMDKNILALTIQTYFSPFLLKEFF